MSSSPSGSNPESPVGFIPPSRFTIPDDLPTTTNTTNRAELSPWTDPGEPNRSTWTSPVDEKVAETLPGSIEPSTEQRIAAPDDHDSEIDGSQSNSLQVVGEDGRIDSEPVIEIPGWEDTDPSLMNMGPSLLLPAHSAQAVLTIDQMVGVAAIVTVAAVGLATSWTGMAAVAILIVNLGFLISIAVKSLPFLVSRDSADHEDNHPGQQDPTLQSTEPHDTELLDPPEWPPVTVLCPMAREDSVCEQLVQSMSELDYPLNKLQVLFIVDDDDEITINAMPDRLPPNMKMLLAVSYTHLRAHETLR